MNNKYIYHYPDHLGNIRLSYFNNGSGAEALEENSYYPYGLKHTGTNQLTGNTNYSYKYNGKELQESGMYDYGARFYMPDIGRWGVVDAMAEAARRWNPYTYGYDNPIRFIDPDGNFSVSFSGEAAQQAFSAFRASMSTANTDGESAWPPRRGSYDGESYSDKDGSWSWNEQYDRWNGVNGSKNVMLIEPGTEVCCNLENTKVMTYSDVIAENMRVPMSELDGPIKMMGGAGDVFGIWELLGIALGASDSNAKYAMLPLMVVKGQGDDALKMLNAEKGLLIQANQRKGIVKAEYLFENLNDAKNLGSTILGPSKVRMYNENGKWIGWENKSGNQVYWKHGDWGQGKGSSTFPHINYIIDGQKGHFYLKDKMINRGEWESFKTYYKNYFNP